MRPPHDVAKHQPTPGSDSSALVLKAVAFVRSDTTREDLQRRIRELPGLDFTMAVGRDLSGLNADIAFLEIDIANPDDLAFIAAIKAASAMATEVVAIANAATPQDILSAVRAGAEDVLVRPIDTKEIRQVVARLSQHRVRSRPDIGPRAHLLSFAHASGGTGATTLAVNAAVALAQRCAPGDVCLLDLDIQYGSVASQLDLPPTSPLREVIENPDRLDHDMLEGMMVRHESGLRVLTAPRLPLPFEAFNPAVVGRILETAQRHHRFVVVDLPHALTIWMDVVMRRSNTIYLVTQLSVPAIHQLKKFYDILIEEHLDDLPVRLVVNRQQGPLAKGADVSPSQIERVVGRPVNYYVPSDYGLVVTTLNQGRPAMVQSRTSRFAEGVRKMLEDATGPDFFEGDRAGTGLSSFSKKLFGARDV